jgi:hypothetical protein
MVTGFYKKRTGHVKGTEEICSKKTAKLGEEYFCFKRKRDKETYGRDRNYINYGTGNNRYSTTIFIASVKYLFRDYFFNRLKTKCWSEWTRWLWKYS